MPEEINRIITDRLSNLLFCPTQTAVKNLKEEGIERGVFNIGDVMFDAALKFAPIAEKKSRIFEKESIIPGKYLLLTLHRAENTNYFQKLRDIVSALVDSKEQIVFPVHPRTIKYLQQYQLYDLLNDSTHIKLLQPVSFIDMIVLEKNAQKILTDSGGVQKEAYFYKVPCITLREETEWVETVEDGWNKVVGANYNKILDAIENFFPNSPQKKHFGEGKAGVNLCKLIG